MTSQISASSDSIDPTFPVAGQDNDSQGFRDNFAAIKAAFTEANAEVSKLQTNGIFSADLTTLTPTHVSNNLQQSVIHDGGFYQLNGVYYGPNTPALGTINVDLNYGPIQKFVISGNSTLHFQSWPASANYLNATYATVRVMLIGDQLNSITPYTINFSTSGAIKTPTGFSPITISANGKYEIVEAWTVDGGAHVFIKSIGEY